VIRQASVPVLTLRPDDEPLHYPYRNVLVPTDGSACATAALEDAVDIVNATGATLHLLSVVDVANLGVDVHSELQVDALGERAEQVVQEAKTVAENAGVDSVVEATEFGSAIYRVIQSYVNENDISLIVMGTHGRTGIERYLLGSVTEKTVRTASVPVLTIPDSSDE
jgi:nucleotide-binding universal stress UspA family protein